ncbi:glucose-1-phosphate adenylyltransferase large subunit 1-like isoform X1 [Canna indica]|uniref:Glucose-1-phosphate adenylyltransferase n=1 Tax=Canna indica TaxID=4628 RepID=A0AAQ3L2I0_9LILI|nr:glucose-1-phosphate adenylyltransferase large subunit 1-like isoform X1 [Canna indica]
MSSPRPEKENSIPPAPSSPQKTPYRPPTPAHSHASSSPLPRPIPPPHAAPQRDAPAPPPQVAATFANRLDASAPAAAKVAAGPPREARSAGVRGFGSSTQAPWNTRQRRWVARAAAALRVAAVLLAVISFSVMVADKTEGWDGDSYGRYEEFRYLVAVNVIVFVYSLFQAYESYRMIIGRPLRYYVVLSMDQILAYLLMSASSAAASRNDAWVSAFGSDKFTNKAGSAITISFLVFIVLALSSIISAYDLFRGIHTMKLFHTFRICARGFLRRQRMGEDGSAGVNLAASMDSGVASLKANACLSQVKRGDFGSRGSGIWGKAITVVGSRTKKWRPMVAKNATSCCRHGELKAGVAASAIIPQVNGETVTIDVPFVIQEPIFRKHKTHPKSVASIILGGGPGNHLFPLTNRRATPAVPIGGCYRLIDIPMSNCINSGINKIFVMTQFNSASLNRHISNTYNFGDGINFGDGFVEVLAATQSPVMNWFQGTADAVRQFAWVLESHKSKDIEYIVVLSGDQLYRMDYMDLVQKHVDYGADITISCVPVDDSRPSDYGLVKIDKNGRITQFHEKPRGADLEDMKDENIFLRLSPQDPKKYPYIASMGVYVFNKNTLLEILRWAYPKANYFESHILPSAVNKYNVQAYHFEDYWEDIGTIKSFFNANLALTEQPPKFQFYDPRTPIFTSPRFLPPTKVEKCRILDSIVSHGCFLHESSIEHSIIGARSRIDYGAEIKDTLLMGAEIYETEAEIASLLGEGRVPIGVGQNTQIRNCIIDMNARIGKNVVIANKDGIEEGDRPREGFYIRSGITIITKNATIKDGTLI